MKYPNLWCSDTIADKLEVNQKKKIGWAWSKVVISIQFMRP